MCKLVATEIFIFYSFLFICSASLSKCPKSLSAFGRPNFMSALKLQEPDYTCLALHFGPNCWGEEIWPPFCSFLHCFLSFVVLTGGLPMWRLQTSPRFLIETRCSSCLTPSPLSVFTTHLNFDEFLRQTFSMILRWALQPFLKCGGWFQILVKTSYLTQIDTRQKDLQLSET